MKLWSEPNSSQLLKPPFFQIIQKKKKNTESFLNSISRYASFVCLPSGEAFLLFFFCFSILSESMWFWIVWLCFWFSIVGVCRGSSWFHSENNNVEGISVFLGRFFVYLIFFFVTVTEPPMWSVETATVRCCNPLLWTSWNFEFYVIESLQNFEFFFSVFIVGSGLFIWRFCMCDFLPLL